MAAATRRTPKKGARRVNVVQAHFCSYAAACRFNGDDVAVCHVNDTGGVGVGMSGRAEREDQKGKKKESYQVFQVVHAIFIKAFIFLS